MPPREFIDIALQVLGRHLVVDTDEASLQQCPEAFNSVRMRLAAHIRPFPRYNLIEVLESSIK